GSTGTPSARGRCARACSCTGSTRSPRGAVPTSCRSTARSSCATCTCAPSPEPRRVPGAAAGAGGSAGVEADEGRGRHHGVGEGVAHVVRREARGQAGRLAQRVQGEDVAVRRVPGRRVRAAVAVEAEVVAAPGDPGTLLAGREHVPLRLYPGQHPVDEGAAWSV